MGKMYFWWIIFQSTFAKLEMSNVAHLLGEDAQNCESKMPDIVGVIDGSP